VEVDFEFSSEQEELRATVRRFLDDRAPVDVVRHLIEDANVPAGDLWLTLGEMGVLGLLVPASAGGAGMGMLEAGVVLEEMGRSVYPGPFLSSAVGAVTAVTLAGTANDRHDLLPGLADGTTVGTVGIYEPGARYRWDAPSTTAERGPRGWSVTGRKTFVPDALGADLLIIAARDDQGIGLFVIDRDAEGLEVTQQQTVDDTRRFGAVALSGAPAHRLGTQDATDALAELIDRLLVAYVVDGVGAADAALAMSVSYAGQREQFGQPIGAFQAVGHLCADMLTDVELSRAGAYYALWAADHEGAAERHRAATMAKAFASDALVRVSANAIQVHGGIGFTWEHDVHLLHKRLMTVQQVLGGAAEHLDELADIVV
jgi:alkylation response protein AidB-like acyl-CoA dehydrogenase